MNVFDLPGPQFLVFYIALAAGVGALSWLALSWVGRGGGNSGAALLADPYQIACLRLGLTEVARLAIVSLSERGLLELPRAGIIEPAAKRTPRGLHPVEQAILVNCPRPTGKVSSVLTNSRVKDQCRAVREPLIAMGLAPSTDAKLGRAAFVLFAGMLVVGVGLAKLDIAQQRGHSNVGFLIFCMIVVTIFFIFMALPRPRTPQGSQMLADLRRLLSGRRGGGRQKGMPQNEALLLGAVFGAAGLAGFGDLQSAYARATTQSSGGGGCSSSSCGSSGCGGGGGCGGCGSD